MLFYPAGFKDEFHQKDRFTRNKSIRDIAGYGSLAVSLYTCIIKHLQVKKWILFLDSLLLYAESSLVWHGLTMAGSHPCLFLKGMNALLTLSHTKYLNLQS